MAKTPTKTPTKTAVKKAPAAPKASALSIEKATEDALEKLKELDLDHQLQADIQWCLGSYKADQNPAGLYDMVEKAITVLTFEKDKKTKGVTSKLIGDLEKALKSKES